jgi:hypothetical protein
MEMAYAPLCDYYIVNDDADTAAQLLRGTILAENSRRALVNLRVELNLPRHRLAFAASALPCYGNEVLFADEEPHFPTTLLVQGELPHEAALRTLSQALNISTRVECLSEGPANNGAFVPPVTVSSQECAHFQRITFIYHYYLESQIAAPSGWAWLPRDQIT